MSGRSDQVKGHIKEATGIVTGDKDLEAEGKSDRKIGEAETQVEHAKDKVDDVVEAVKAKADEVADKVTESLHHE
jgi:uncharacterized protein YjbJ (UPF0337 family)